MNILVTGGLGAIGSWATRSVIESGNHPVVFDSATDSHLIGDIRDQVDIITGSISDLPSLLSTIANHRIERVIHTAALMPPACHNFPDQAIAINIAGALNVMEACRLSDVKRLVCFSSKAVYGSVPEPHNYPNYVPVPESLRLAPINIYGGTKVMVEELAKNFRSRYGLSVACLRLASTFGPGKSRHGELAIHSQLIDSALAQVPMKIKQGGEESCDLIFNGDVGRGAVAAVLCDTSNASVFNIGTGQAIRFDDFAAAVRKVVPGASIDVGGGLNYMEQKNPTYCVLDVGLARKELDFRAKYFGEEAVAAYVDAKKKLDSRS